MNQGSTLDSLASDENFSAALKGALADRGHVQVAQFHPSPYGDRRTHDFVFSPETEDEPGSVYIMELKQADWYSTLPDVDVANAIDSLRMVRELNPEIQVHAALITNASVRDAIKGWFEDADMQVFDNVSSTDALVDTVTSWTQSEA